MRNNEELKLLLDSVVPENFKQNHELFKQIFDIFFEYISDSYIIGSNTNLILEPNEKLWGSDNSTLYHTDLTEIKGELVKTYLYDVNRFVDAMRNNPEIYTYFEDVYDGVVDTNKFDISHLMSRIDSDEFLNHKKISQQKTIPVLFNSIMAFINKMQIPNIHGVDSFIEMYTGTPYNPKKPFSYTINSSIPKPVYDGAIDPAVHPVGFGKEYKYEARWTLQDFVNLDVTYENWKVYTITTERENMFFDYSIKNKKLPHCTLTYAKSGEVTQFDVDYPNTVSSYGLNLTDITLAGDGNSFVRVSENEYKLVTDRPTVYESSFNGMTLLNSDGGSNYSNYDEENFNEDNNIDGHGGMVSDSGDIIIDGKKVEGYRVENNHVMVLMDAGTDQERWEPDNSFEIVDGFIFKINIKNLFTEQAVRLETRNDFIKVYDRSKDVNIFTNISSHSFFVTFEDISEPKYIWSTNDQSNAIAHSFVVTRDKVIIFERGGLTLEAFKTFKTGQKYHFVVQWDNNGRRLFVDNEELFLINKTAHYNEKIFFDSIRKDWIVDNTVLVNIDYKTYSLAYNIAHEYEHTEKLALKVVFKKSGYRLSGAVQEEVDYVLFESMSDVDVFDKVKNVISENKLLITAQKGMIMSEFEKRKTDMSEVEAQIELNRINKMFEDTQALVDTMEDFSINIDGESVQWLDIQLSKDEFQIKNFFDNILDINNEVFNEYGIMSDNSNFEFMPGVNQIIIGNSLFHYNEGVSRVGYILDNYDIFSRPLTTDEIDGIFLDHDGWVLNLPVNLEHRWSLDNAIWDSYHSELEYSKPTLWDIGETFIIGMENLLIKYYIASNSLGADFDCHIDKYIDHPKALIDYSILYDDDTVVWENVEYVSESVNANNELFIFAQLDDGTRLEYVKDKYLKHVRKFISDHDGNEYPLDIPLTSKTIKVDYEDNRVYDKKIISYILESMFESTSDKITRRIDTWEGILGFNNIVDDFKIEVAKPLIRMVATYVLQDPALVSNPSTVKQTVEGPNGFEYKKTLLEDEGHTVYDSFITLEFLASYDDPNIETETWDSFETTREFEDVFNSHDVSGEYIIGVESYKYVFDENGTKVILEEIQTQGLIDKEIFLNEDGIEVFFSEDIIEQYPSSSFMDYSYDIRIDAFNKDEVDYVLDFDLGEFELSDYEIEQAKKPTLCTRRNEGRIYINMETTPDDIVVPSPRFYDRVFDLTDEWTFEYGNDGLGGLINSLNDLTLVITDFGKTLDLTQYKFNVGIIGRKTLVSNNKFFDKDGVEDTFNESDVYFGIPENPDDEFDVSRYQKVDKSTVTKYFLDDKSDRQYIIDSEEPKIRTLIGDTSGKTYYDNPEYTVKQMASQEYVTIDAPIFIGYTNILGLTQVASLLKDDDSYYTTSDTSYENVVNNFVDVTNAGYWVNKDGKEIQTQPSKEFVYYYDRTYKIPVEYDSTNTGDSQLYVMISGTRHAVFFDGMSNNYYYIDVSNNTNIFLSDTERDSIFVYFDTAHGQTLDLPKFPQTTLATASDIYVESGGSRVWKEVAHKELGWYYYEADHNNVPQQVRLPKEREDDMYTIGGIGLKDSTTLHLLHSPDLYNYFYFSSQLWDHTNDEHQRIFLTTAQKSTIVNGKATIQMQDEQGNTVDVQVKVYVPKYYIDDTNTMVYIKENDYKNIEIQYDGSEFIYITTKIATPTEDYIKLVYTEKREVTSYPNNPYYTDRFGEIAVVEDVTDIYSDGSKYYINTPEVKHVRIYPDEDNQWVFYYLSEEDGSRVYIDKDLFDNYSKSFLSSATRYYDIPKKTTNEVFEEFRLLSSYTNSANQDVLVDNNGWEYMSPTYSRFVYETADGREYFTAYDNLGRYYFDESNTKVYITEYDRYFKSSMGPWYKMYYTDNDELYVSREGIIDACTSELSTLGFTRSGHTLFHDVF